MTPTSTCKRVTCNRVTPGTVATCPACGSKTISSRRIVILGWLLLVIGLVLIGGMGYIFAALYNNMTHPGVQDASGATFTGTAEQGKAALQLFAGVIAFGVLAALNGLWQIVTGRRNLAFSVATVLAAGALFFVVRQMLAPGGEFAG